MRPSHTLVGLIVIAVLAPAPAGHAAPATDRLAAVQTAPGRVVLPMKVHDRGAIAVLGNGAIVIPGISAQGTLETAQLLPSGRLNPAYGDGGFATSSIEMQAAQIFALPDGKLLVAGARRSPGMAAPDGTFSLSSNWQIARLLPTGAVDQSFGAGGVVDVSGAQTSSGGGAQLAPNGDILLVAGSGAPGPQATSALVRLHPDGSRDTSFGTDGTLQLPDGSGLMSYAIRPDGSIVAVTVELFTGPVTSSLMRFTPTGAADPGFGGGSRISIAPSAQEMLMDESGAITVLSYEQSSGRGTLHRYRADGTPDTSWGAGGAVDLGLHAYDRLVPARDGAILLYAFLGDNELQRVQRVTAGGAIDPAFGGGDGRLVVIPFGGGTFEPGAVADLNRTAFDAAGYARRPDGTLLTFGTVRAEEVSYNEGGMDLLASASGTGIAALTDDFALDPSFGAPSSLRLRIVNVDRKLSAKGVVVRLGSSGAALSVLTLKASGRTIGRVTVPFLVKSFSQATYPPARMTARVTLTTAGTRLVRRHRRLRVRITASARDLAGNRVTVGKSVLLKR